MNFLLSFSLGSGLIDDGCWFKPDLLKWLFAIVNQIMLVEWHLRFACVSFM